MKKILLVEDNDLICGLVVEILEERGHRVLVAQNLTQAHTILADQIKREGVAPDCIISDRDLKISDEGITFLKFVNENVKPVPTKVLFSGRSDGMPTVAREVGAHFLPKPFRLQELVTVVEKGSPVPV